MKEIFENVISSESFWTVITGMIVYILSQYYMEFFANPRKEYKKLRQRIIYTITMYCCYYTNPYNPFKENENARSKEEYDYASKEIRKIGSELAGYIGTIPKIRYFKRKKLNNVLSSLIGISNGFYDISKNFDTIKENKKLEKIIKDTLKFN